MKQILFITGTDTGVGKTVLTSLLAAYLHQQGVRVAALKPVCSGGRGDALILKKALGDTLPLDEINPWHFKAPLAPVLAAQREKRRLEIASVLAHIRSIGKSFDVILVEGAGGLLSPLGVAFDSRDLVAALAAQPIIVASDKLGVVNHILLTLEALPKKIRNRAKIVLMAPKKPDSATASNAKLLEQLSVQNVCRLPWLGDEFSARAVLSRLQIQKVMATLTKSSVR